MDYVHIEAEAKKAMETLSKAIPDSMKAFSQLAHATFKDGALNAKTKELIALGIAISVPCEGCIAWHAKAAHQLGATREEIGEMVAVALEMRGGPSLYHGARALDAYDQFAAEAASTRKTAAG